MAEYGQPTPQKPAKPLTENQRAALGCGMFVGGAFVLTLLLTGLNALLNLFGYTGSTGSGTYIDPEVLRISSCELDLKSRLKDPSSYRVIDKDFENGRIKFGNRY